MSDDLTANSCDELVAILQKHSAILKSGVLGIENIVDPTSIAVKGKRLTEKRKRITEIHPEEVDKVTNTKCNILGYFAPREILLSIFSEYLSMDDVSRFDVAICEKAKREEFLILIRSNECIFDGGKQDERGHISWHGIGFLNWLSIRGVEIKHLKCHNPISENELLEVVNCGKRLQKLDLSNCRNITDKILRKIILSCPNITELNLAWCSRITDKSVIKIAEGYPNLTSLKLSVASDKSIAMVAKNCLNLNVLDLSECNDIRDISFIRIAENCPNLTELYLCSNHDITDIGFIRIAESCPNLRVLFLPECIGITDKSVIKVAENCPNLKHLNLMDCLDITDKSIMRIAENCPNLEHLNLIGCDDISDESIMRIAECCSNLRILDLSGCRNITDICVTKVADSCPNLTSLSLINCARISDISIVRIAKSCPSLTELDLSFCNDITDRSLIKIADRCHKLKSLTLSGCNITNSCILRITEGCPCLRRLDLSHNKTAMRLLGEVYPYITVTQNGNYDSAFDESSLDYDSTDDYASSMVDNNLGEGYDSDQYTVRGTRCDGYNLYEEDDDDFN